jgi:hypothetical protein
MQHRYALKTDFVLHLLAWLRLFQVLGDQVCENTIQQGLFWCFLPICLLEWQLKIFWV